MYVSCSNNGNNSLSNNAKYIYLKILSKSMRKWLNGEIRERMALLSIMVEVTSCQKAEQLEGNES